MVEKFDENLMVDADAAGQWADGATVVDLGMLECLSKIGEWERLQREAESWSESQDERKKWLDKNGRFSNYMALNELNSKNTRTSIPRDFKYTREVFKKVCGTRCSVHVGPLRAACDILHSYAVAFRGNIVPFSHFQTVYLMLGRNRQMVQRHVKALMNLKVLELVDGHVFKLPKVGAKMKYYLVDLDNAKALARFLDGHYNAKRTLFYRHFHEIAYYKPEHSAQEAKAAIADAHGAASLRKLKNLKFGKNVCRIEGGLFTPYELIDYLVSTNQQAKELLELTERINKKAGFKLVFAQVHLHRSPTGKITGASLRPYTYACLLRRNPPANDAGVVITKRSRERATKAGVGSVESGSSMSDELDPHSYRCRMDYLKEKMGSDADIGELDMRASIHNVSYAMLHGGRLSDEDIYTSVLFPNESKYLLIHDPEKFRSFRAGAKLAVTVGRFTCSDKEAVRRLRDMGESHAVSLDRAALASAMSRRREVLGCGSRDTTVFITEALIYLKVVERLLSMGLMVYLVYDCFYFDRRKVSERMIMDEVRKATMECWLRHYRDTEAAAA